MIKKYLKSILCALALAFSLSAVAQVDSVTKPDSLPLTPAKEDQKDPSVKSTPSRRHKFIEDVKSIRELKPVRPVNEEKIGKVKVQSIEGGVNGGGGDVVLCRSGFFENIFGPPRVYLADTFELAIKGLIWAERNFQEDVYLETVLKILIEKNPELGKRIDQRLQSLTFTAVKDLPEYDDDNIDLDHIEEIGRMNCTKKQLAIQNFSTGQVLYNRGLYLSLSQAERALFKVHEAFIGERQISGDTTMIRAAVQGIAEADSFAAFLASTVYQDQLIPEYRPLRLKKLAVATYMFAVVNGYSPAYQNWLDFLRPKTSSYQTFRDGELIPISFRVWLITYYGFNVRNLSVDIISKALKEKNVWNFIKKLDELYGPTWVIKNSIKKSDLEDATEFLNENEP